MTFFFSYLSVPMTFFLYHTPTYICPNDFFLLLLIWPNELLSQPHTHIQCPNDFLLLLLICPNDLHSLPHTHLRLLQWHFSSVSSLPNDLLSPQQDHEDAWSFDAFSRCSHYQLKKKSFQIQIILLLYKLFILQSIK